MAEYGLLCAKLRDEGLGIVSDVIEKLQAERDKLLRERAALIEVVKESSMCCRSCAHVANQYDDKCNLAEVFCDECACDDCYCKDCAGGTNWHKWEWKGAQE